MNFHAIVLGSTSCVPGLIQPSAHQAVHLLHERARLSHGKGLREDAQVMSSRRDLAGRLPDPDKGVDVEFLGNLPNLVFENAGPSHGTAHTEHL